MKNLCIIDLESTCFEKGKEPQNFFSEIIEIGAVILDTTSFEIIDEYQTFVKPVLFPTLSGFCKNLTSISQEEVDTGKSIQEAIKEIKAFYTKHDSTFASWGFYDKNQFKNVCERFRLSYPFHEAHISLKHEHGKILMEQWKNAGKSEREYKRFERGVGMERALKEYHLPLDGTHHRGIDDARNIAKIASKMIQNGWK